MAGVYIKGAQSDPIIKIFLTRVGKTIKYIKKKVKGRVAKFILTREEGLKELKSGQKKTDRAKEEEKHKMESKEKERG